MGIFEYPKFAFAHDIGVEKEEVDSIIQELAKSKLVEFEHDEGIVRIVGSHYQVTGAANSSSARSRIADYRRGKIAFGPLLARTVDEFSVAIVSRSLEWNPEKGERAKLHEKLRPFLLEYHQDAGSELLDTISIEIGIRNSAVSRLGVCRLAGK